MKYFLTTLMLAPFILWSQQATVRETTRNYTTYPFSNPDPVPNKGAIYPYFRFEDFSATAVRKDWKVVELENDYIKVTILPEIGGKIWSATEKATGKEFLYNNHVVKFRDVAMRGPWTSGGIEANYGIIGHTPNCATPVDYLVRNNPDGSVSCFIGTLDLLTRTNWTIEIRLPADKAWFSTRSWWFNSNALEQPYYTWMNAGIKAAGNLEFVYPGNAYIGHEGEHATWPVNEKNGKPISLYEENNFGSYKSYHVFGRYTDFFGAYWHDDDFGMGRFARHDEKAGKKIWIWGLSRQGMIWDKILTDSDGQYVEVQSGRLFNQSSDGSSLTPFKHFGFAPYQADTWTEYWYPVAGTKGFVTTNPHGSLNVKSKNGKTHIHFQALEPMEDRITVTSTSGQQLDKAIRLRPMEIFRDSLTITGDFTVRVGNRINWSTSQDDELSRPKDSPSDMDWSSPFGLYLAGKEAVRSRYYDKAQEKLEACLSKDPNFLPALGELAALIVRKGDADKARALALRGLAIDTYDPQSNFVYGLANVRLGKWTDARDGFDIASMSGSHRSAAFTELARIAVMNREFERAAEFATRALESNTSNVEAIEIQAVVARITGNRMAAVAALARLEELNPLHHFSSAERWLASRSDQDRQQLNAGTRNELAHETYLELAAWYIGLKQPADAAAVLSIAPQSAEVLYWRAWLDDQLNQPDAKTLLTKANNASPELVFPFREEAKPVFEWALTQSGSWKPHYYLALIHRGQKNIAEARKQIKACGDTPDFAAFYVLRSELTDGGSEQDLVRATTLQPNQWIYAKHLFEAYMRSGKNAQALTLAQTYLKRSPGNSAVTMMVAKGLLLNKQYPACIDLLGKSTILPYEGSTDTRQIWWAAHLLTAMDRIKSKRYPEAQAMVEKTRIWPENLGVGKPYDSDIDQRVESLIEALILRRSGKTTAADEKLASFRKEQPGRQSSVFGPLAQALYHRLSRSEEEGKAALENWVKSTGNSALAQWCLETYNGQSTTVTLPADQQRLAAGLFELLQ